MDGVGDNSATLLISSTSGHSAHEAKRRDIGAPSSREFPLVWIPIRRPFGFLDFGLYLLICHHSSSSSVSLRTISGWAAASFCRSRGSASTSYSSDAWG